MDWEKETAIANLFRYVIGMLDGRIKRCEGKVVVWLAAIILLVGVIFVHMGDG